MRRAGLLLVLLVGLDAKLNQNANNVDYRVPRLQGFIKGDEYIVKGRLENTIDRFAHIIVRGRHEKIMLKVSLNENEGPVQFFTKYSSGDKMYTKVFVKAGESFDLRVRALTHNQLQVSLNGDVLGLVRAPISEARYLEVDGSMVVETHTVNEALRQPIYAPVNLKIGEKLKFDLLLGKEDVYVGLVDKEYFVPFYMHLDPAKHSIVFNNDRGEKKEAGKPVNQSLASVKPGALLSIELVVSAGAVEAYVDGEKLLDFEHRTSFPEEDYQKLVISDTGAGYVLNAFIKHLNEEYTSL